MADQKQVLDMQVSKGITAAQSNEHLRDRSERAEKYAMNKGNYDRPENIEAAEKLGITGIQFQNQQQAKRRLLELGVVSDS